MRGPGRLSGTCEVTNAHRLQILTEYNAIVQETGEPKRAFLEVREKWREKLRSRNQPFSLRSLYRWSLCYETPLLSSRMSTSVTTNPLPTTE